MSISAETSAAVGRAVREAFKAGATHGRAPKADQERALKDVTSFAVSLAEAQIEAEIERRADGARAAGRAASGGAA